MKTNKFAILVPMRQFLLGLLLLIGCSMQSADGVPCMPCTDNTECADIGAAYFCSTIDSKCSRSCQNDGDCPGNRKCDTQRSFTCLCS